MKKRYSSLAISFIFALFAFACTEKLDRQIKRKSKIIRETETIIYGYYEASFEFIHLNLRKNQVFDINAGALWFTGYYAGTWSLKNDTLYLDCFNNHIPYFSNKAFCNKEKNEFLFLYKKRGEEYSRKIKYYLLTENDL